MSHDEKDFEMNREFDEGEFADLAQALREARSIPEPGFTERLDQAVEDHFPPEWAEDAALGKENKGGIGSLAERFRRRMGGRRLLLPAMAGFAGLLLMATVVVGAVESDRFNLGGKSSEQDSAAGPNRLSIDQSGPPEPAPSEGSRGTPAGAAQSTEDAVPLGGPVSGRALPGGEVSLEAELNEVTRTSSGSFLRVVRGRDVAREAEITLGTDPAGVQDVANEVVSVTDEHNGIVMNSNVVDGEEGEAGATFRLLIPTRQIESAVADLSGIADLRSRSQELTDITSPTSRAQDAVADSKAKIRSLLGELEETFDENERARIEQRIRWERNDLRMRENRLKRLERKADYTPVALAVETGGDGSSDGGSWGLSDAVEDAGKLLGVAAGVTVLALAVAIPIGIVVLIALALNRAWVRRSRNRALADD